MFIIIEGNVTCAMHVLYYSKTAFSALITCCSTLLNSGCLLYTVTSVCSSSCVISSLYHVYCNLINWSSSGILGSLMVTSHGSPQLQSSCSCSCDKSTVSTEEKLPNLWSAKLRDTCVSWTNWKGDSRFRCIGRYCLVQINGSHRSPFPLYMTCQNGEVLSNTEQSDSSRTCSVHQPDSLLPQHSTAMQRDTFINVADL